MDEFLVAGEESPLKREIELVELRDGFKKRKIGHGSHYGSTGLHQLMMEEGNELPSWIGLIFWWILTEKLQTGRRN